MDISNKREHILVCLSASPSNVRVVEAASKMAEAFDASFTALFVSTPDSDMSDADKNRLQSNCALAESLGATVATVYGDDVVFQIAEYARLSRVTKVIIGRSSVKRRIFGGKQPLTEKLNAIAPDIEVHIIPDNASETKYTEKSKNFIKKLLPTPKDVLITVLILGVATGIGMLFSRWGLTETNIITVYVLSVLITALFTQNYLCNVIGSIASVLVFNLLFVEPLYSLRVNDVGTYVTFAVTLIASLITGTLANRLQYVAKQSAQSAYRTKVLFDTNRLLQRQQEADKLLEIAAKQLVALTDRDVTVYSIKNTPSCKVFSSNNQSDAEVSDEVLNWLSSQKGSSSEELTVNGVTYTAVAIADRVYGAVGIGTEKPLESLEKSIAHSVIGECALAIDNVRNSEEKEAANVKARQERLRADMLRAISHDLRTPLTAIAGNADYLLNTVGKVDENALKQIYGDIYDDSMWLYALVENLLSVTRLEDGKLKLNVKCELADELIEETLRHLTRRSSDYLFETPHSDKPLLVRADAKLILQVLINLVDNAVKYTPKGSTITISAAQEGEMVRFFVADNGNGIADNLKDKVFEMFYTGDSSVADGRRSLGLGLALCKSIVTAHGGELTVHDNIPHGSVFSFTVPVGEVTVNE